MYDKSIFIFHKSLRLNDNIGLLEALKNSKVVIPIFIFTSEQLGKSNKYKSSNCVQFMIESLEDLNNQLKGKGSRLLFFYGINQSTILKKIIKDEKIDAVYFNKDYTPYAIEREKVTIELCEKAKINFHMYEDILLLPIGSIMSNGHGYMKFTPYYRVASKKKVERPITNKFTNYYKKTKKIDLEYDGDIHKFYTFNENISVRGGRDKGLKILKNMKKYNNYNEMRDTLTYGTTHLSSYNKFGCVSIREVYYAMKDNLKSNNQLFVQLYWREFFYNVAFFYPIIFTGPLKENYKKLKWDYNDGLLSKWTTGTTGYPVIDACMREMNTTGHMHNRGRLLVACFLTKTLYLDWKNGEMYFAQKLVDYDPVVNLNSWTWVVGSSTDSMPYFRIFNPWLQSLKHDPDAIYIKKWIPELKNVDSNHIHKWYEHHQDYKVDYPQPCVDYKIQTVYVLKKYKQIYK